MKYQVSTPAMPFPFSVRQLIRLFFRSLLWSLNVVLALYTLFLYWLLDDVPVEHWSASMLMITLPIAWALNITCLLIWFFTNPWRCLLSLLVLLAGFWLWPRTIAWNDPVSNLYGKPTLTLLSYNLMNFNAEEFYRNPQARHETRLLTDWVVKNEASVKCFQEFYNSQRHPSLRMIARFDSSGYAYKALLYPDYKRQPDMYVGLAIFSRYPILNQGREAFGPSHNGIVWADIKIGADTVRVINVHLESMGIRVRRVLDQQEMAGVRLQTRGILSSLREGFMARQAQIRTVERYVDESPYPVVVTGDFNETPYSVVYGRMRAKLHNAFEDAGRGFGFSLNRAPSVLRIDNQFYDANALTALRFKTLRHVPYSDHYPILGNYMFERARKSRF